MAKIQNIFLQTLIFTETKRKADDLTRSLRREGCVYEKFFLHLTIADDDSICLSITADNIVNSSLLKPQIAYALCCFCFSRPFTDLFLSYRWPCMCIHGDKSQPERDWVLNGNYFPRILCYKWSGKMHQYKSFLQFNFCSIYSIRIPFW